MNKRQRKKQKTLWFRSIVKLFRRDSAVIITDAKVRRKFCRLHGWAPHQMGTCFRCTPVHGITKSAAILAYLRGWKRPRRMRNKEVAQAWLQKQSSI
jgi:hypothetical protein